MEWDGNCESGTHGEECVSIHPRRHRGHPNQNHQRKALHFLKQPGTRVSIPTRAQNPWPVLTTTVSKAVHLSFVADHFRSRLENKNLRVTKARAAPTTDPARARKNPFIPYANPHNVTIVVWPVIGGNEIRTGAGSWSQIIREDIGNVNDDALMEVRMISHPYFM